MNDSIFTKIIKGGIPGYTLYEDDEVIAILDVHPMNDGHTLVIPKQQVDQIWDLDDASYQHLMAVAKTLGARLRSVLQPARVGMVVEGFGVPHVHVHLIPINHGNDLKKPQDLEAPIDHEALRRVRDQLVL